MSNSTRLTLRTKLRRLLNEPTASNSFWSDADLNAYLQEVFERYYNLVSEINPEFAVATLSQTYTASSTSVEITSATIKQIDTVWDITEGSGAQARILYPSNSIRELLETRTAMETTTLPTHWYFNIDHSISSGVITRKQYLYLAPTPSSTRSLQIIAKKVAQSLDQDTYTTGLDWYVEECMIFQAAVKARLQENADADIQTLETKLSMAEMEMLKRAKRSFRRTAGEIEFHEDLLY